MHPVFACVYDHSRSKTGKLTCFKGKNPIQLDGIDYSLELELEIENPFTYGGE
jgi:hypothetical protein